MSNKNRVRRGLETAAAPSLVRAVAIAAALTASSVFADNYTWTGTTTGVWSNASNWSGATPPPNSNVANVFIDGGNPQSTTVTVDANFAVAGLTIDAGDMVAIANNQNLTFVAGPGAGTIVNNGTINFGSVGNQTGIVLSGPSGTISLSGSGVLTSSDNTQNRIDASSTGMTLANSSTILATGFIDNGNGNALALVNSGTLGAVGVTTYLISPRAGLTNTGTLEAGTGAALGTLQLSNTSIVNTNGRILANASSAVVLVSVSIADGSFVTSGTGVVETGNGDFGTTLSGAVTVSSGSTLDLVNNSGISLMSGLTLTNNGTLALQSAGNNTQLQLVGAPGTVTLGGTGVITMSDNGNNRIVASSTGMTVLNSTTIQGAGLFDNGGGNPLTLLNEGTISAIGANTLIVSPRGGFTNAGLLEAGTAVATGTLQLNSMAVADSGHTILANASSAVVLIDVSISSPTFTTIGSGVIEPGGGNFGTLLSGGATLTSGSDFAVVNNSGISLASGTTFVDNGTISLQSIGNATQVVLTGNAGSVTLTGTGIVSLSDNGNNRFYSNSSNMTLVNALVIQGAGYFDNGVGVPMAILNSGTLTALGANVMLVSPRAGMTNTGVLEAGNGNATGNLLLTTTTITNTGHTILANASSAVILVSVSITDGTFSTLGNGIINTGGGNFDTALSGSVTLSAASHFVVLNNSGLGLVSGMTLANNGTITFQGAGNNTEFYLSGAPGTVTLSGSGVMTWSDDGHNRIFGNSTGMTLLNATTIEGAGSIDAGAGNALALINTGTITANSTNNAFVVAPQAGLINNGILQAGDGVLPGVLELESSPVLNSGGTITANVGSTINLVNGLNIVGGVLKSVGTGAIQVVGGQFNDELSGDITLAAGSHLNLVNNSGVLLPAATTLTNNGTIAFQSSGNNVQFYLFGPSGTVTLNGSGQINLSDNSHNRIVAGDSGMTLVNDTVIQGAGLIDGGQGTQLAFINAGTITATFTDNAFIVAPQAGLINNGLLQAGNGVMPGVLQISTSPVLNSGGTITANVGSNIVLTNNLNIVGGLISSIGSGFLQTAGGNFNPTLSGAIVLAAGSNFDVVNNSGFELPTGTVLTNNGAINFQSTGNTTQLAFFGIAGTVTLAGAGSLNLDDNSNNRIVATSSGVTFLNTSNIQGAGFIGDIAGSAFTVINQGSITALGANALILSAGNGVINTGLIRAGDGVSTGTLDLQNENFSNNAGTMLANQGSTIVLFNAANIIGGTLMTTGTGSSFATAVGNFGSQLTGPMTIAPGTLFNINNNSGVNLVAGSIYTNNGHIALLSTGNTTQIVLNGIGTITLSGSGSVTMSNDFHNRIITNNSGITLDNASGHTIDGVGSINNGQAPSFVLTNEGTITADGAAGTLFVAPGISTSNTGTFRATNGATLSVTGVFLQDTAGTLTAGTYIADAASLINLNSPNITDIGAAATVILNGANSQFVQIDNPVDVTGFVTQNDGTFELLLGRSYTVTSAFTNNGTLQLGGGSFTATTLTNNSTGTIVGFGTIAERPLNHGTIEASGGTLILVNGINGGSGTIQSDPGSVLDLSGGTAGSNGDFLVNNGSLTLGANNVLVAQAYSSANFGSGNAFNKHADVSVTTGKILADGNNTQTVTGSVTGADQADLALAFGNIHVGDTKSFMYQVNNVGTAGPAVLYAIQTAAGGGNITDARLNGSGVTAQNLGPVALGGSTAPLTVNFSGVTAGAMAGQSLHIANNFDGNTSGTAGLVEQTIPISGAAYRYANPVLSGNPVNFSNVHVGDAAPVGHYVLSNIDPADGFSEGLDATLSGASGSVAISGGVSLLPAGQTASTAITTSLASTATAGHFTGTALLTLTSDGTGTSNLGLTNLSTLTLTSSIAVYRYANGVLSNNPVDFHNVHQNDTVSQLIPVSNEVPTDGFSEGLNGSLTLVSAPGSFSGNFGQLIAGGTANITASLNTAIAGPVSNSATLTLYSDGANTSGLGITPRSTVTLTSTGTVYRLASAGALPTTINLGTIHVNASAPASTTLSISNTQPADGYSEQLSASFTAITDNVSTSGGPILVDAGGTDNTHMQIFLDASAAQLGRSGTATVHLVSSGNIDGLMNTFLVDKTITVTADVLNYAVAALQKNSGGGNFSFSGTSATLDFGTINSGDSISGVLAALNNVLAPADTLGGMWTISSSDPGFTLTGFDSALGAIAAGQTGSNLGVSFTSTDPGEHTEVLVLHPTSSDNAPYTGSLPDITLTLDANVSASTVPEPASLALLLAAAPVLLRRRRRQA